MRSRFLRKELLSGVGLSESGLHDVDRRIPESERAYLWREAAARSDDTEFGLHVVQHADMGAYDVLRVFFPTRT